MKIIDKENNPLGYEDLRVLLARFAVPSIASTLVIALYSIVDQIFIGQGVGYLGNAATNVTFPFCTISLALSLLIGVGSAARFSIFLGEGENERAARVAGNCVTMTTIVSVLLFALCQTFMEPMLRVFGTTDEVMPYALEYARWLLIGSPFVMVSIGISNLIRADGSPRFSMFSVLAGAVLNTILDPVFIFVFHWGMFGAAIATVAGQILSFFVAAAYMPFFRTVRITPRCFRPDLKNGLKTCVVGAGPCANQVAITFVQIALNNSLTYYGALSVYGSEIPLAACGVVIKVNSFLISFIVGIGQGALPIIGFNYGARQYDRVKKTYLLAIKCTIAVSAVCYSAMQLFPRQIISAFGSGDPLYMEFAVKFVHMFLCMVIVGGVQIISSMFFTSMGKAVKGMLLSMTRQVFFFIPLVLLLPLLFGLEGVLCAGGAADFASFVVSVILVRREFKRLNSAAPSA